MLGSTTQKPRRMSIVHMVPGLVDTTYLVHLRVDYTRPHLTPSNEVRCVAFFTWGESPYGGMDGLKETPRDGSVKEDSRAGCASVRARLSTIHPRQMGRGE